MLTLLPWAIGAIWWGGPGAEGQVLYRLMLVGLALTPAVSLTLLKKTRWRWLALISAGLVGGGFLASFEPSQGRDWNEDQAKLARVERRGDALVFHHVRDFDYLSESQWTSSWISMTVRPDDLKRAYFVVEHFGGPEAIAHTMVSFEFAEDRFLVVSVEIRKERGESYDPIAGLFQRYELAYVLATERDALKLRTHHRKSRVHLHPIDVSPERLRAYFLDVVARVESLSGQPEFYHTLTSSCNTNLARHFEAVTGQSLAGDYRIYLPGYSSALIYDLGLSASAEGLQVMLDRDRVDPDQVDAHPGPYSQALRGRPMSSP